MTLAAGVVVQLSHPVDVWSSYSCWAACAGRQVAYASNGQIRPTWLDARKRSGRWVASPTQKQLDAFGPGNLSDEQKALQSYADDFAKLGLQAPRMRILGVTTPAVVRQYLAAGASLSLAIGYRVINQKMPRVSGSPTFNDGHAICVQGLYDAKGNPVTDLSVGGRLFTDMEDPLADGRRPGIAKGPQRVPLWLIDLATAAVPIKQNGGKPLGAGKVLAAAVFPAKPIPTPAPEPPPSQPSATPPDSGTPTPAPDPCVEAIAEAIVNAEQERDDAFTARDAANAEVGRLQGVVRQLGALLTDTGTPLADAIALASDPANTGGNDQ